MESSCKSQGLDPAREQKSQKLANIKLLSLTYYNFECCQASETRAAQEYRASKNELSTIYLGICLRNRQPLKVLKNSKFVPNEFEWPPWSFRLMINLVSFRTFRGQSEVPCFSNIKKLKNFFFGIRYYWAAQAKLEDVLYYKQFSIIRYHFTRWENRYFFSINHVACKGQKISEEEFFLFSITPKTPFFLTKTFPSL